MRNKIDKEFDELENEIFSRIIQERNNKAHNTELHQLNESLKNQLKSKEVECKEAKKISVEVAKRLNDIILKIKSILQKNAN